MKKIFEPLLLPTALRESVPLVETNYVPIYSPKDPKESGIVSPRASVVLVPEELLAELPLNEKITDYLWPLRMVLRASVWFRKQYLKIKDVFVHSEVELLEPTSLQEMQAAYTKNLVLIERLLEEYHRMLNCFSFFQEKQLLNSNALFEARVNPDSAFSQDVLKIANSWGQISLYDYFGEGNFNYVGLPFTSSTNCWQVHNQIFNLLQKLPSQLIVQMTAFPQLKPLSGRDGFDKNVYQDIFQTVQKSADRLQLIQQELEKSNSFSPEKLVEIIKNINFNL